MSRIAHAVDSLVSVFSPKSALERAFHRELLAKAAQRSQYAAAQKTRLTGDWSPVDSPVNTVIGNSLQAVRARVRQLVRDFPILARAVDVACDYTVGDGIKFQSRVKTPEGKLDKKLCQKIEDEFSLWMDDCDVAGRQHYYEIMALSKRQDLEAGEFVIAQKPAPGLRVPLQLQVYEGDWLADLYARPADAANLIQGGIEYQIETGRVVAYHMSDPENLAKPISVPAGYIIHGFKTLRPNQRRGISPFAPGVLLAKDLQDIMEAELDGNKMASKYLALVKTDNPAFRQAANGATVNAAGKKIESLENAIIEYLQPGEDVVLTSNPRPGNNFPPFIKLILTMFSIIAGVPYEMLSGNYEGLNYSTGRMVRNDFAHQLRTVAGRHVRHFCRPTFRAFLDHAVAAGRLALPGYFRNPAPYLACEWQPPGMESIDPLREVKARIDEIKAGLRSPQEYCLGRGRNLEDVLAEIAEAKELAAAKKLVLDLFQISTAVAGNPAAVTEDQRMDRVLGMLIQHFPQIFEGEAA